MSNIQTRISFRKGLRKDLPQNAPVGEPLFCMDTSELFVGTGDSISKITDDELNKEVKEREHTNKLFRKSIVTEMPLLFSDYDSIIDLTGATYIYPQGFNIDFTTKEIFVVYSPTGGTDRTRWIVIFDLDTGKYKYCFGAGQYGGEGLVVKYENNRRYLYVKSSETSLGKYDITSRPINKSKISPIQEYNVGLFFNFAYKDGKWAIEQGGASLGTNVRRDLIAFFNDNLEKTGQLKLPVNIGGTWEGAYTDYIPKRQGLSIGQDCLYQSTGGYWRTGQKPSPYNYSGIKVINTDGTIRTEALVDPKKFSDKLNTLGYPSTMIEYEGSVFNNNELYSICVIQSRTDNDPSDRGVLLIKEFSNDEDAIDFSDCATTYVGVDLAELSSGIYPRSADGNMYNCFTGKKFSTLYDILTFMMDCNMQKFNFYSSSVSIAFPHGFTLPNACYVEVINANNSTFFVNLYGDGKNSVYISYINEGQRKFKQLEGEEVKEITLMNGITNFHENSPLRVKRSDNNTTVTLTGTVKNLPMSRPVVIGMLPEGYQPKSNLSFMVALSASSNGGYGVITVSNNREIRLVHTSLGVDYCSLNGITYLL